METLRFLVEYPFTWVVLALLLSILFYWLKKETYGFILSAITVSMAFSITPTGTKWWLNSIPRVLVPDRQYCQESAIDEAILLPGGVVFVGETISLTNWSKHRLAVTKQLIESSQIEKLIIPGGSRFQGKLEGHYINDRLRSDINKFINVEVGTGSHSTYGNFIELESFVDKDRIYSLITSEWHAYRSVEVAKKLGFKVCPIAIPNVHEKQKLKEYPWKFKAAVREYLAVAFYQIQGRI